MYIYPGNLVGLDSPSTDLQNARNTIGQLTNAWHGGNGPSTFYAAAAQVGYDPATLLSNLHSEATDGSFSNMAVHHNGGGIENLNVTTSGLDAMLLQSSQNDVKVFADWPVNTNAKFGDQLAYGGFLVSSDQENSAVQYIRAISQAGSELHLHQPVAGPDARALPQRDRCGNALGDEDHRDDLRQRHTAYRPQRDVVLDNSQPHGPAAR